MALFELSRERRPSAVTTISPRVVAEQKHIWKYTSGISDVVFHAEVKSKQAFLLCARINNYRAGPECCRHTRCNYKGTYCGAVFIHSNCPSTNSNMTYAVRILLGTALWAFPHQVQTKGSSWSSWGTDYHKMGSQSNEIVFLVDKQCKEPPHQYFQ